MPHRVRRLRASVALLAACAAGLLSASPAQAQAAGPAVACGDLAGLVLPGTTITTAEAVTGGSFTPPGATAPLAGLPDFCRVAGTISPVPESRIGFETWLPLATWNGRYMQVGNGGFAGRIRYDNLSQALRGNFATASTDNGGDASLGTVGQWALGQPQRIIDFAERGVRQTGLRAKEVVHAFYGRPAQ
jgi:feruloyl esterase